MNYYLKNKIQKLINETLEDKANEVMEKLKFNKPGSSFDYVEEAECSECGGMVREGECSECGYMSEGDSQECNECGGEMMEDDEMDFKTPMRDAIRSHKGKFRTPMRDAMAMRSRKDRHNDVEDDMNEVELDEKLYGNQKRIDKNHNGRLDSQDFKMLRKDKKEDVNENVFYELTTAVNGKREKLLFNESQFEEMIENIVLKEEGKFNKGKTPAGYAEYERSIKTSKKNEEGYMKDLSKKMKDYLKDGSKGKYEMSPKNFPKGNGELEEMSKKAYVASGAIEDYIDNFTAAGLENLDYDEIHPDEDWVTDNVVGSSRTGNNPEWANAVETPNNEKRNKIRKDNMLAKLKRKAYNKAPQPVVTDKSSGGKADSIMTKLESIDEKKKQKINEDFTRIMNLMSYKKNTQ